MKFGYMLRDRADILKPPLFDILLFDIFRALTSLNFVFGLSLKWLPLGFTDAIGDSDKIPLGIDAKNKFAPFVPSVKMFGQAEVRIPA